MSNWNRTPLQILVTAGMASGIAQALSLGLWLLLVSVTVWRIRRMSISFSHAFALAFVLLYLGRPVGWGLPYLAVVVLGATWPLLVAWQRWISLGFTFVVLSSHWVALYMTLTGQSMALVTLQTVGIPWETLFVLPLSWFVLLKTLPPLPRLQALDRVTRIETPVSEMVESSEYTNTQHVSSAVSHIS